MVAHDLSQAQSAAAESYNCTFVGTSSYVTLQRWASSDDAAKYANSGGEVPWTVDGVVYGTKEVGYLGGYPGIGFEKEQDTYAYNGLPFTIDVYTDEGTAPDKLLALQGFRNPDSIRNGGS
ncbi:hypothetical protein [Antrihabitans cavernicola]|uniref:Uncharacterized protein n=1 Tax=Antrihabitans cavernicola TaxID=2495913 RepID=A0A5A7SFK8_9NOCA|nr:hypothetical protein [Spelaeibacter cavernicola]KAA0024918.1 hypothetical protein FOY51_03060 [Spelaeibacter cavernicola]